MLETEPPPLSYLQGHQTDTPEEVVANPKEEEKPVPISGLRESVEKVEVVVVTVEEEEKGTELYC